MMRRSQVEKMESHERILDVAARQIRAGGPDSISISGLMKAVGLTHGGFYRHFASRDALIQAAIRRATRVEDDPFAMPRQANQRSRENKMSLAGDVAQAGEMGQAGKVGQESGAAVRAVVERYLSRQHRDNPTTGCAIAALATDVSRLVDVDAGQPVREQAEQAFSRMSAAFGGGEQSRDDAIVAWCAMLGALTLARVFRGDARSDEILALAKQHIVALAERSQSGSEADA